MMSLRYLFVLIALVLFVTITNAALAKDTVDEVDLGSVNLDDDVEARNPLLAAAIRIIGAAVKWAAKHCLQEAALNCKQHWNNPKALVKCGKAFLQANKGRCVVG